ncbi:MAG: sel1 repeat family protein [Rhodobacteraceae bacterium]|nr:sel1 repeat family protein [Paracoccaceae bacterium]
MKKVMFALIAVLVLCGCAQTTNQSDSGQDVLQTDRIARNLSAARPSYEPDPQLLQSARDGDEFAQIQVASHYYNANPRKAPYGLYDPDHPSWREAERWFEIIARSGDAVPPYLARLHLACMSYTRKAASVDAATVLALQNAADTGWSLAFIGLSKMYRFGHGVEKNPAKADELVRKAVELYNIYPGNGPLMECDEDDTECSMFVRDYSISKVVNSMQLNECGPEDSGTAYRLNLSILDKER